MLFTLSSDKVTTKYKRNGGECRACCLHVDNDYMSEMEWDRNVDNLYIQLEVFKPESFGGTSKKLDKTLDKIFCSMRSILGNF